MKIMTINVVQKKIEIKVDRHTEDHNKISKCLNQNTINLRKTTYGIITTTTTVIAVAIIEVVTTGEVAIGVVLIIIEIDPTITTEEMMEMAKEEVEEINMKMMETAREEVEEITINLKEIIVKEANLLMISK